MIGNDIIVALITSMGGATITNLYTNLGGRRKKKLDQLKEQKEIAREEIENANTLVLSLKTNVIDPMRSELETQQHEINKLKKEVATQDTYILELKKWVQSTVTRLSSDWLVAHPIPIRKEITENEQ